MLDRVAARKLVSSTFQSAFDKERFIRFAKELLNHLKEEGFTYRGNYIPDAYKPYIQSLERIGKYEDPEGNKIDVLIATLKKDSSLERARTMQRNFIAWYLNGSRGGVQKEAALVAFVSPESEDWRYSLVKMEYKLTETPTGRFKAKAEYTPAKRMSYLVGVHEHSHTAQSRFVPIIMDDAHDPSLSTIEDAFSIEKATKEFFDKYRELYLKLYEAIDKIANSDEAVMKDFAAKDVDISDFAKKLLGQIVFLYFLQKKGWFGVKLKQSWGSGSKNFMRELFKGEHGKYDNFFNRILEPLFYEALRKERDDDYYSRFDCRIPFLNGGLFDPLNDYDWVNTDILIPNELFSNELKTKEGDNGTGILDIFDRYNFTVNEDEPLEKEVAVDPEMLGKVFENLLEVKDRKSKGTYYTPREIVHYMCQESLINHLATEMDGKVEKTDIETLIRHGQQLAESEAIARAKEQKIKEGKQKSTRLKFQLPRSIRAHAMEIDDKLASVRVCDPAVGSGAFPVGMMNEIVRARGVLTTYIGESRERTPYYFKRHAIHECLYGVDIDPGAIEIAKLRLWLSLVVDEQEREDVQPLPNLDYKLVCGNSLISVKLDTLFNAPLFEKLTKLKDAFFSETSSRKKLALKSQIEGLIADLTDDHETFSFEVYFSEIFSEKSGFDVLIANPPYIKEDVNKQAFDRLHDSECYQGKMDIWYLFGCRALDILRPFGALCFIATNNWVTNDGASRFRNKVLAQAQIIEFLDFGAHKVFTAGIQTMVMLLRKADKPEAYSVRYGRLTDSKADSATLSSFLSADVQEKTSHYVRYRSSLNRTEATGSYISFLPEAVAHLIDKLNRCSNFRLSKSEIHSGIDVMQDFVTKKHLEKLDESAQIGAGVFVLSDAEKSAIKWNKRELEILKPYYATKEIGRYKANPRNRYWVIYTSKSANDQAHEIPNIAKHLDRFRSVITSVNKPYGLHRTRVESIFLGTKILATRKCKVPEFSLVEFPSYVARTFLVIQTSRIDSLALLAILNSKLVAFWLRHKGKLQGNQHQIDIVPLSNLPLLKPTEQDSQRLSKLAADVIEFSANGDDDEARAAEVLIDSLVYELFGLTDEEIAIVAGTPAN